MLTLDATVTEFGWCSKFASVLRFMMSEDSDIGVNLDILDLLHQQDMCW